MPKNVRECSKHVKVKSLITQRRAIASPKQTGNVKSKEKKMTLTD